MDEQEKKQLEDNSVLYRSVLTCNAHPLAVEKKRPAEAVHALELLSQGWSHREIKNMTGLGWDALWRLAEDHKPALEVRRAQLAHKGFVQAQKAGELLDRKMSMLAEDDAALQKTSLRDLALVKAIMQDKSFDALGESSKVTIEHKSSRGASLEDAAKLIAAAKAALAQNAIDVTNSVPQEGK